MCSRLVMLRAGGTETIVPSGRDAGLCNTDQHWANATAALVRAALDTPYLDVEAYVVLSRKATRQVDREALATVVRCAKQHVMGAPVFLVLPSRSWRGLTGQHEACRRWFGTALREGIADIVELPDHEWPESGAPSADVLREAHNAFVSERLACIQNAPAATRWRYVRTSAAPGGSPGARLPFLHDYLLVPDADGKANVLVVAKGGPHTQMKGARRALEQWKSHERLVATLDSPPSPKLSELCAEANLNILPCRGVFELRYVLDQLNARSVDSPEAMRRCLERVELRGEPLFPPGAVGNGACVIMTSSYNPGTESDWDGCIAAARDMHVIVSRLRHPQTHRVLPCVNIARLGRLLDSISEIAAWVHIGHGYRGRGLSAYEPNSGMSGDQLLACFRRYKRSLPLVFLASCHSSTIARSFAERGAGVAIGFQGRAYPEDCQRLEQLVLDGCLQRNGDTETILAGFQVGCEELDAGSFRRLKPMAYHSTR